MLQWVGLHPSTGSMIAAFRLVGLAVAGAISFVLLMRSPRIGLVRAFALSSLAIVMLGPVVWPWYLATGFALLAATGVGRWRPTYIVLLVSATALVWPSGISPLASVQHYQNGISPLVVAFVIGVCWVGQRMWAERARREQAELSEMSESVRAVRDVGAHGDLTARSTTTARPATVTVAGGLVFDLGRPGRAAGGVGVAAGVDVGVEHHHPAVGVRPRRAARSRATPRRR